MMACRLVACGSSVYVQKKSSCVSGEPEALETCSLGGAVERVVVRCGCCTVAVETEEDMMANVYECAVGGREDRWTTDGSCCVQEVEEHRMSLNVETAKPRPSPALDPCFSQLGPPITVGSTKSCVLQARLYL